MATLMPATWRVASPAEGGKAPGTSLLARARGAVAPPKCGETVHRGYVYDPLAPPSFNDACAALCERQPELLLGMLRYRPTLAAQSNKYGVTLLHWAAYYNALPKVVRGLVAANAAAARERTASDGCLPLHIGAAWGLGPQSLAIIFAAYPSAADVRDANGRTPAENAEQMQRGEVAELLCDGPRLLVPQK